MQILGNIFIAVIFVSAIGSIFAVISLFINNVLRLTLPLWFSFCGMLFFCVPFLAPDVLLLSPETQDWISGFRIASFLWACGCGVFLVHDVIRLMLAKRAIKNYQICDNERLNSIYSKCAAAATRKKAPTRKKVPTWRKIPTRRKAPTLYCGTLDNPICTTGVIRPVIIMNEKVMEQLTDRELSAVFSHELTHVKRKHVLLGRIYDYVCILNWMNPFSWIARRDFSLHCETDCDSHTMKMLRGKVTETEYASAIIRLLEYATVRAAKPGKGAGALDFLLTKRRITRITAGTSKIRDRLTAFLLAVLLAFMLVFSMGFSREIFYPYPAYGTGTEYSAGYNE